MPAIVTDECVPWAYPPHNADAAVLVSLHAPMCKKYTSAQLDPRCGYIESLQYPRCMEFKDDERAATLVRVFQEYLIMSRLKRSLIGT